MGILQIHAQIGCQKMRGHWHNYVEAPVIRRS